MAGALQQTVCHRRKRNVCGASRKSAFVQPKRSTKAKKGTFVLRVKLTAARAAFLHGRISELMECL
jgi:hypothetical protein